jgi:hypothetical protein
MLGAHLRPVGIEFFGDEGGKAGERPLPEFDVLGQDGDGVVGADTDEGIRCEYRRLAVGPEDRCGTRLRSSLTRQMEGDDKPAHALKHRPAR